MFGLTNADSTNAIDLLKRDHDEVEEVRWLLAEIRRWVAVLVAAGHERSGRKMVKKTLAFFGTRPFLRISSGLMRASASSGKAEKAL